ncbi:MAG: hypothetical protein A2527_06500 [Candidatus Lambdaproteobacteria bacterium RIFOXYD2_FULL_50_16]|uniref:HEAT repeat domain-containing protein n=1 Tax=Candidatus Lambdaproteobacteria bacterium RIFOXYD2_FULL_50_16 TaxID=1817772 RepID=A0A1F6GA49_9PROT|nr:MAG: hypothetical protein A2527_06500 [Candidatus Lambdaproteobacteria bacterium RIFOXYD2_FULL_50_16]
MLEERHLLALDQLSNAVSSVERQNAYQMLLSYETAGEIKEADLLMLLGEADPVVQSHARGALARLGSEAAKPKILKLFAETNDPILLEEILETFTIYGTEDFIEAVIKRLANPIKKKGFFAKRVEGPIMEQLFDKDFVLRQILIPSIKYLGASRSPKAVKVLNSLIEHDDPMIRLNCLAAYDKIGVLPGPAKLAEMSKNDPSALVRDEAQILIEKHSR